MLSQRTWMPGCLGCQSATFSIYFIQLSPRVQTVENNRCIPQIYTCCETVSGRIAVDWFNRGMYQIEST